MRLWNEVSSYGAYLSGLGVILFLYIIFDAFAKKRVAGNNPWGRRSHDARMDRDVAAAVPSLRSSAADRRQPDH